MVSIYQLLQLNQQTLIKAALVHYQFEMIHPFERYNGIVGRIIVPAILCNIVGEAKPLICLSEYLYHNKDEYFDLLQTTQYSGGYIRWIKFCVNAINETAKRSAELLIQYEDIVAKDIKQLEDIQLLPKSVWRVYDYPKLFPVTSISHAATQLGSSFNSISNALHLLRENGIVTQENDNMRNRIWRYTARASHLI